MSKETGGPAFPDHGGQYDYTGGMTLRDYFAAKAMQGICSHADTWGMTVPQIATESYRMADAMLKARGE